VRSADPARRAPQKPPVDAGAVEPSSTRWTSADSLAWVARIRADTQSPAGLQALGRGGGERAATLRTAPRPPALSWYRARTRAESMTDWVSGVRPLASRDAGLRPAARLARSRCAARSACSPRATSRGQARSMETTWQQVPGAWTTGGGRFPKLRVRVRFRHPLHTRKPLQHGRDQCALPMRRMRPSAS